ncbi:MAG: protein kinase family protein [Desulfovibrio sp.]|jgi:serine/threonine-protein kinase|nr:protein kinase family protein [Desulfovibrio sp.]
MKSNGDIVQFLKQKDYVMLNNALGSGSFGKTVLLKDAFIDEIFVAKKYEPNFEDNREAFYKNFLDEIKIMYKLNHRNVVRIFNYYAYEDIYTGYIIMEYIDGVDIGKYISDYDCFPEKATLDELFIQLIDGFQYIEKHGIIHRDIREGNILIDKSGVLKIIDFGIGKAFEKSVDNQDSLHSEINRANSDTLPQEYAEGIYTSKTDQFYLAEMFNRLMREAADVTEADFSYHTVISRMMQKDPSKRYNGFVQIKDAIGKYDFSVMSISDADKIIYQNFANSLYQALSEFTDEQKFNYDTSSFIAKIEKSLVDNSFEDIIQKNSDIIGSVVIGAYRYNNRFDIECKTVRIFIDWFKKCIPQSQQLILNNIIHKLSMIKVRIREDDVPF